MKKLFALILALVMTTALTVPAFALTSDLTSSIDPISVWGTFVADTEDETLSVDLTWGAMTFQYVETKTWNTEEHDYDSAYAWQVTASGVNEIEVENNSSIAIDVTLAFEPAPVDTKILEAVTYSWTGYTAKTTLDVASAPLVAALNITGGALSKDANNVEIGEITVTLARTAS